MFGFRRNTRNTPAAAAAPAVTVQDGTVAEAWKMTPAEWLQLTDDARRDCRARVAYALQASARAGA